MTVYRIQAVFQGGTNLPEDRFVNTWHFDTGQDTGTTLTTISAAMGAFYINGGIPGQSSLSNVGQYISPFVNRAFQLKVYNLADGKPRVPTTMDMTLPAAVANNDGAAEQIAAVLSFTGSAPITRHKRGRIYLGPLSMAAISGAGGSSPTRLAGTFRGVLMGAAQRLAEADVGWCIKSGPDEEALLTKVVAGWVDDRPDTQRRRSVKAANRGVWTAAH